MDSFCCKHDSGPQKPPIDPPPNIILCTNAFGLGVDKGDICSVILLGLPMSINELVQQSGRAHRDPKKVKLTTGVDGEAPKARAILLTDGHGDDLRTNRFLIDLDRIHGYHLDRVWKSLESRLESNLRLSDAILGGAKPERTDNVYETWDNVPSLGILSFTLDDLRNEWDRINNTGFDILSDRMREIEFRNQLYRLDDWDEGMETRFQVCLYWLERMGLLTRMSNLSKTVRYRDLNIDADEVDAIEKDLALFKAKSSNPNFPFEGNSLRIDLLHTWRQEIGLEKDDGTPVKEQPKAIKFPLGHHAWNLREKVGNQIERKKHTHALSQFLACKLCAGLGHGFQCTAHAVPYIATATPIEPRDLLPFRSKTLRALLHPMFLGKLIQKSQLNPDSMDVAHLFDTARDVLHLAEKAEKSQTGDLDFSNYSNSNRLLSTMTDLGFLKGDSSISLILGKDALATIDAELSKYTRRLCEFFKENGNSEVVDNELKTSFEKRRIRAFYNLIGAASYYGRSLPHAIAKDKNHQKAVWRLAYSLSRRNPLSLPSGATVHEVKLGKDKDGKEDAIDRIKKVVEAVYDQDPLFRLRPDTFLKAFIQFLTLFFPDQVQIAEGNYLLSKAYTIKLHKHADSNTVATLFETSNYEANEALKDEYSFRSRLQCHLIKCRDLASKLSFKADACKGENEPKEPYARSYLPEAQQISFLIKQELDKLDNNNNTVVATAPCGNIINKADLIAFHPKTYARALIKLHDQILSLRGSLGLEVEEVKSRTAIDKILKSVIDYPPKYFRTSPIEKQLDFSTEYAKSQLDTLAYELVPADRDKRNELIRANYDPKHERHQTIKTELSASYTPSYIPVPWDNIIGPLLLASRKTIPDKILNDYLEEIPDLSIPPGCTSIILMADGAAEGPMGSNKDDARLGCGVAVYAADDPVPKITINSRKVYKHNDPMIAGYQWTPFGGLIGTNAHAEGFAVVMACLIAKKLSIQSPSITSIIIQSDSTTCTGGAEITPSGGWFGNKGEGGIITDLIQKIKGGCKISYIPGASNKADAYSRAAIPEAEPDEDHNIRESFEPENLLAWGYTDPTQPTP